MSHATVLVIGENIEAMMAPYKEGLSKEFKEEMTVEEMKQAKKEELQKLREIGKTEKVKEYEENDLYYFVKNWYGYKWNEESEKYGYWHNPKAKWDWWIIGGRFSGTLKCKVPVELEEQDTGDSVGKRGKTSWIYDGENPYEINTCDQARKRDLTEECLKNLVTYAVLDQDGWHEKSQLGWWGISCYDGYCCIAKEINIHKILKHFKYDYFGISTPWTGYNNKYVEKFIRVLHKHYERKGNKYVLKKDEKVNFDEDLQHVSFFRDMHWSQNFYDRFIKDLDDNALLTIVDYHI